MNKFQKIKNLFNNIVFNECKECECKRCCFIDPIISFSKEEKDIIKNFGKSIKKIDNVYWSLEKKCKFYKNGKCSIYLKRPLDCRLFPLDIIKEKNKYYWCIYTTCPNSKWQSMSKKLIPLIPLIEANLTKSLINQQKKAAFMFKKFYSPYKKRQYKIVSECNVLNGGV